MTNRDRGRNARAAVPAGEAGAERAEDPDGAARPAGAASRPADRGPGAARPDPAHLARRRGTRLAAAACGLLLASCARIDHGPDLQQAAHAVERASGLRPEWQQEPRAAQPMRLAPGGVLPLDEAVRLALANNAELGADREVIGQARAELVQAGLLPNPVLSIMLGFPEAGGLPSLAFGLSQELADLWLIPTRRRAAQALLRQRILSLADSAVRLVAQVRTSYVTLQYLSLASGLQSENVRVLRESLEIAHARLRAGDASQLDVNLIQGRLVEAEIELLALQGDYRVTQRGLARLMGLPRAADDWRPEPAALETPVPAPAADEAGLIEAALAQRLDVQAARWELESAVADFAQQRLRLIQSLGAGISGERFERRAQPGRDVLADAARASLAAGRLTAPEIESRAQRRQERGQEIELILGPALELSIPIFDQNQARVAQAQFRARELQRRYEDLEQRAIEGVRSALTQHRVAAERVRIFRESLVPLQKSNLELAQIAYQAGRESILAVLLAQQELIRANLNHAAAWRDLAISAAVLERELSGQPPAPAASPASAPAGPAPATREVGAGPVEPATDPTLGEAGHDD